MKTIYKITSYLILICLFTACSDYTSGKRFDDDYIVIAGTLYAGEPITLLNPIIISRAIDISGGISTDILIRDAEVIIEDSEGKDRVILVYHPQIGGYVDSDSLYSFRPQSGETYRLTVKVGDETVYAETTVPAPFEFQPNNGYTEIPFPSFPEMPHSQIDNVYPIRLKMPQRVPYHIYTEFYCLEEWTDAEYVLSDYLGDKPETESDYANSMNGSPQRNRDMQTLYPNEELIITIPFNQINYFFYGRYMTTIQSVDENFYKYRYKSQGYFHGGISAGGAGYFGSASRVVLFTKIVRG